MALQKGPFKIKGTLGDTTFAETKNGFTARNKSRVPRDLLDKGRMFEKFRHNKTEFTRCLAAVKLMRHAFEEQVALGKDSRLSNRLQKQMMAVVKSDTTTGTERGMRTPQNGDLDMFRGFEFNERAQWNTSILTGYSTSLDRVSGKFSLTVEPFTPRRAANPPEGSDHFRILCACSEVDFAENTKNTVVAQTAFLPIDATLLTLPPIAGNITPNSTKILVLVVGIQFAQVVNGFEYPDTGGDFNSLTLVTVEQP